MNEHAFVSILYITILGRAGVGGICSRDGKTKPLSEVESQKSTLLVKIKERQKTFYAFFVCFLSIRKYGRDYGKGGRAGGWA